MNKIFLFPATILVLALASCGGNNDNRSTAGDANRQLSKYEIEQRMKDSLAKLPPKAMSFEEALADTLSLTHNVSIEGYLQLPQLSSTSDRGQSMNFYGRRNQMTGKDIYTNMPTGSGKNKMKSLPENYKPSDVSITDKNGNNVGLNERVKLTGSMYASKDYSDPKKYTLFFTATEIEKVEEKSADYPAMNWPELTTDASKKEENYGKPFYLEGKLEVPMFVLTGQEMSIDLVNAKGEKFSVKVVTGSGNNQMEDLAENWSQADVKIRDNKGAMVSLKKTVRVYGVLALDGLHLEEIVTK
ncbi:MAG: hypothetical protein MUC87_11360 [Bacteroidia bacterium]|jgi:hypothetical protein|nr:hypothetical protein [Bacteroidia bacterium]